MRLWRVAAAFLLAVLAWNGSSAIAAAEPPLACAPTATHAAPDDAAWATAVDNHEECALVERVPESSEEEPAAAWPWPAFDCARHARERDDATAGTWRRAPARRKCARGPPAAAS